MKRVFNLFNISKPILSGILVTCILITVAQFVFLQRQKLIQQETENRVEYAALQAKVRIQNYVFQTLSITRTLSYLIEHHGVPENFESVGKELLKTSPGVHAIEIVEQGTITHVYPLKGNEAVINYNIFEDKDRKKEALKTRDRKHVFFAGPFELKQGGIGVVGRVPIFINNHFFGFSAIVIKLDSFLYYSGIQPSLDKDIEFQISKINPNSLEEEFFISENSPEEFKSSYHEEVDLPMGEWKLFVKLKKEHQAITAYPILILGLLLSLISGVFTWYIAKQPYALKKQVSEQLKLLDKRDQLLSITQETAKVGSWEAELSGEEFRWTETTRKIYEAEPDYRASLDSLVYFCADGEGKEALLQAFDASEKKGEEFDLELKINTYKGNEKWVRITGKPSKTKGVYTHLYGATLDINRQKRAELEKQNILQSITDAFFAVNSTWQVTYWNRAAERMFKIPQSKILGKNIWDFLSESSQSQVYKECLLAVETQQMRQFEYYSKTLQIRAEVSLYPGSTGLSAYLKNVTQLHLHLEAIQDQNKKLKEIAWMQSHVFRAPLSRLMGAADLLNKYKEADVSEEKLLEVIQNSSLELDEIVRKISEKTHAFSVDISAEDRSVENN